MNEEQPTPPLKLTITIDQKGVQTIVAGHSTIGHLKLLIAELEMLKADIIRNLDTKKQEYLNLFG